MKYLWLISQEENSGYETYDSAVVCAKDSSFAKTIYPGGGSIHDSDTEIHVRHEWVTDESLVSATKVGLAEASIKEGGVVLSSFNAG